MLRLGPVTVCAQPNSMYVIFRELTAAMDDIEERAKALIAEYGDLATGGGGADAGVQAGRQDFLHNGPGMPQQRRQALLKHMTGWAPQFKDFLISPN